MRYSKSAALAAAAILLPAFSAASHAVVQERIFQAGPTALCQSALPVFDGVIRKRPLAVQNEGSEQAFVTCSFITQGQIAINYAALWAASNDGTAKSLTCTGVTGFKSGPNQFVTRTIDLPASGIQQSVVWMPFDFVGTSGVFPSSHFSVSCALPPGAGINQLQLLFNEDVGQ